LPSAERTVVASMTYCGRNELPSLPCPVIREQPAKSGVVRSAAQKQQKSLPTGAIDGPRCVGFSADRLPDLLAQILRKGLPTATRKTRSRIAVSILA
jgi:hypothetical protein